MYVKVWRVHQAQNPSPVTLDQGSASHAAAATAASPAQEPVKNDTPKDTGHGQMMDQSPVHRPPAQSHGLAAANRGHIQSGVPVGDPPAAASKVGMAL